MRHVFDWCMRANNDSPLRVVWWESGEKWISLDQGVVDDEADQGLENGAGGLEFEKL